MFIDVQPIGSVSDDVLEVAEQAVWSAFALRPRRLAPWPDALFALDRGRGQYSSPRILRELRDRTAPDASRVLGLTPADIYIPMLTFVFGQAQLDGTVALVSLARLRQEFYGLPADPPLLRERAAKEVVHELGHTFGLVHCLDAQCGMSLSSNIQQIDSKSGRLCAACTVRIAEALGTEAES